MLTRKILIVAVLALAPGLTLAQQAAPAPQAPQALDDLDAERLNATQVRIDFEYDGGACETVGTAQLGDIVDGTLAVTFPTTSTAEVCTMQVVEIEVDQSIEAGEDVTAVAVTLLAPDGTVIGTGTDSVERH